MRRILPPREYDQHPTVKFLARLVRLIDDEIPRDPNANEYSLGATLGRQYTHWRRAKLFGRYRLFFRFRSDTKLIVYVWLNDEQTLRKAGATSDPYAVFLKMLVGGHIPDDWDELLRASQ